jgi:hypothetical protein
MMATRGTVGIKNADGSITSIYTHWDSYPSHNGKILKEHYTTEDKVRQLMQLGNLSVLGAEIGEKQNFDAHVQGWCLAYGRDRGEEQQEAITHRTIKEWKGSRSGWGCEYGYLFDIATGKWRTYTI